MTPDDITRLADCMEFRARHAQQNGGTVPHDVLTFYAAELRQLAERAEGPDPYESWNSAIIAAGELVSNAPDARFRTRAESVKEWIDARKPTPGDTKP